MSYDNEDKEANPDRRKTIALDFDGVLHKYSKKWHDGTIYDDPVDGAVEAVNSLIKDYNLVIFTCREPITDVYNWVREKFGYSISVTTNKPHADMYIDDRGYHFNSSGWEAALREVEDRARVGFQAQGPPC